MILTVLNETIIFIKIFQNDGDYQFDNDLIVEGLGESCSCTNLTVYSECYTDNPEIGTFNSVGDAINGWSLYESSGNASDYQLYFDTSTKVFFLRISKRL